MIMILTVADKIAPGVTMHYNRLIEVAEDASYDTVSTAAIDFVSYLIKEKDLDDYEVSIDNAFMTKEEAMEKYGEVYNYVNI